MKRVVIDTNVFIGSAYNPSSASRRIVDACREGTLVMVMSTAMRREYELSVPRAVRRRKQLEIIRSLWDTAETVEPAAVPRAVRDDPEDDKFFAAAWHANADAIITNDDHLLAIDGAEGVRIMRPGNFLRWARG
ncbi:MAG: putative toxin-antitoxin system toxin component, PIN family [bacterium]|nr:putative toxin-antitoxin system toxin component, PIN family [bacterium]